MKYRHTSTARTAGFTLCSAMVAALLAGCAGGPASVASTGSARVAHGAAPATAEVGDGELAKIEARVAKSPRNASARAALAQGYLAAGRFESAATTFADAASLGDHSPRTGLSLALSYIGSGRRAEAQDVLARFSDVLPVSDYGLAIALAGRPDEGVEVLSQAIKGGANTPKLRQNLAYAYALGGRWAEARVIASQDLAGDELDARLREWASVARPDFGRQRVAGLLGAPLRGDPGQPVALALNQPEAPVAFAAAEPVTATGELPSVQEAAPMQMPVVEVAAAPAPVRKLAVAAAAPAKVPAASRSSIKRAFDGSLARDRKPVVKPLVKPQVAESGSHLVQLGSFKTMDGAKRAWAIFQRRDPSLRDHSLRITEADVNGVHYYRVAAEGFARGAAQSLCSSVKGRGGECLAFEDKRSVPNAVAGRSRQALASR